MPHPLQAATDDWMRASRWVALVRVPGVALHTAHTGFCGRRHSCKQLWQNLARDTGRNLDAQVEDQERHFCYYISGLKWKLESFLIFVKYCNKLCKIQSILFCFWCWLELILNPMESPPLFKNDAGNCSFVPALSWFPATERKTTTPEWGLLFDVNKTETDLAA